MHHINVGVTMGHTTKIRVNKIIESYYLSLGGDTQTITVVGDADDLIRIAATITEKFTPSVQIGDLAHKVIGWARSHGIVENSTPQAQALKLVSEVGELADNIIKGNTDGLIDDLGDCVVVLLILAEMHDLDLFRCLAAAYNEIKDRKGHMSTGGAWVKED